MGHPVMVKLKVFGASLVAAMLVVFGLSLSTLTTTAQEAESTPTVTCNVEEAVAAAPVVYTVDGETSTASYTAQEELASVGAAEAVGTTNAIIGSILFDDEGMPLECSNFAVDMRTLVSDESRRDNYLRSNTLESDAYPYATFVVASVEGLDGPIEDGETAAVQLQGDLTLRDVTQPVTWEAELTRDGETLTGTATLTFRIEDYGMEKPIVGPVVSIGDEIVLNIEITAAAEG